MDLETRIATMDPYRSRGIAGRLAVLAVLLAPLVGTLLLHNHLVAREEAVDAAWAQVESNLQRRADLVPALVETVGRYLRHESETLLAVTQARREALDAALEDLDRAREASGRELSALGDRAPTDAAGLAALAGGDAAMARGVRQVLALAEDYPELRSADQFVELQAQLEGSENRINVSRMRFNDSVRDYNASIRKLPGSLIADARGMVSRPYFRADDGAARAAPLALR
jgi:LemA protein